MKLDQLIKILLILTLSMFFTACNDSKKEMEYKDTLTIPKWDKKAEKEIWHVYNGWHHAKKSPIPATKIGYSYSEELKDYDKAIQWYKYSNSMKPMAENSNYMCYSYQMKKEYEEAIKWCKDAIELGSDDALFNLAYSYSQMKQYDKSINYYQKSYKKTNDKMSANNIGYIYQEKLGKYNKSKEWYKIAIKDKNMESFHNLSRLYHHNLNDDVKASAYSIALIGNKFTKSSVLNTLQKTWEIPNEIIKKGYELQLNSPEFSINFKGDLGL